MMSASASLVSFLPLTVSSSLFGFWSLNCQRWSTVLKARLHLFRWEVDKLVGPAALLQSAVESVRKPKRATKAPTCSMSRAPCILAGCLSFHTVRIRLSPLHFDHICGTLHLRSWLSVVNLLGLNGTRVTTGHKEPAMVQFQAIFLNFPPSESPGFFTFFYYKNNFRIFDTNKP